MTVRHLDLVTDPVQAGLAQALFFAEVTGRGSKEVRRAGWSSDGPSFDLVTLQEGCSVVLAEHFDEGEVRALLSWDGEPVYLQLTKQWVTVSAATDTPELVIDELRKLYPASEAKDLEVPFTFWTYTQHGPHSTVRRLAAVDWSTIQNNYARDTRADIDHLVEDFDPKLAGQLLLWHGEPGTGKTYALRALSWMWREWCDFHYIADPEEFFGRAEYLLQVLLNETDGPVLVSEGEAPPRPRWRCLILEDTGELLAADAKEKVGQGLARLLNVVDGLIGQGLRVLVLVTTNDELSKFHPAITRPGRCAMKTEFTELGGEEIERWLSARGIDTVPGWGQRRIADLYAFAEDFPNKSKQASVGF